MDSLFQLDPDKPSESHLEGLQKEYKQISEFSNGNETKVKEIGLLRIRADNALTYPQKKGMLKLSHPSILSEQDERYLDSANVLNPEFIFTVSLKNSYSRFDRFLMAELEKLESVLQMKAEEKGLISYNWRSNPETELPMLYEQMKGSIIDRTTTLEQFQIIFTGQPVKNISPVKWIAAKNLLAYFIDLLRENKKISNNNEIWETAKHCFENATNLSQLRDLYKNNKKGIPKNKSLIDELLKSL